MRILDALQMQKMDQYTIEEIGVPGIALMENAAKSWIEAAKPDLDNCNKIFLFCGAGNNGGDGYAIARNLSNQGYQCIVVAVKPPKSKDCLLNAKAWTHFGKTLSWDEFINLLPMTSKSDVLIDAILGTGVESEIRGTMVDVIKCVDQLSGQKIAVDIPTGISASTGDKLGVAIRANKCITFQKEKVGHYLQPGKTYSGELICQKISVHEKYFDEDRHYYLTTKQVARKLLLHREPNSYKNVFGHLLVWCGATGTLGAAFLAASAALRMGTGLVTAALPQNDDAFLINRSPELMTCAQQSLTDSLLNNYQSIVLGCGLGRNKNRWKSIVNKIKKFEKPIVLDADAFFGIDHFFDLDPQKLVLTPHLGEFAQLTGNPKPGNNLERIEQGLNFIKQYPTTLVLKGAPSIIFTSDQKVHINETGNAGMATAGSGDVLAGMIGGLLAQGLSTVDAAKLGVWLHGRSGDIFDKLYCQESLIATDLISNIKNAFKELY